MTGLSYDDKQVRGDYCGVEVKMVGHISRFSITTPWGDPEKVGNCATLTKLRYAPERSRKRLSGNPGKVPWTK